MTVPRPVLRWHGGKWLLAPWIIEHFPAHQVYVEPFGGAASVLMRKEPAYAEIYNDLDGDVVNLFRVLRSPRADELVKAVRLTPFARTEFLQAYQPTEDDFERARRLIIRSFMGFGSNGHNKATGFRANSNRSGTTPTHDWVNYPDSLAQVIRRIAGVTVESKDACAVMDQHDAPSTLHYVDPPYVMDTRADGGADYAHEMDDADHIALLNCLKALDGMVVLSGYPHPTYDQALIGWRRVERTALADGAKKRIEVLWINPHCAARLDAERAQLSFLDGAPAA
ncbi:DNA adenine methylase [Devosia sp. SL43]|uniref:DNA adenine methylase n=1 Tax=Devosia sp. SL43 TaxID=2806348 RepID=UPI001F3FE97F|nr:DNA adenine methylase [Devosia sp. SL43]UJW87910.1 DNA adenine methylase [Devosia sp. SL43]